MAAYDAMSTSTIVERIVHLSEEDTEAAEAEFDEIVDWFLFKHNPEGSSFDVVEKNKEVLSNEKLLQIVLTKFKLAYETDIFLEGLNILSCLDGFEGALVERGGVQSTLDVMEKDSKSVRTQILGCKVLANLAVNHQIRAWMGKLRNVSILLEIIRTFHSNTSLVIECCKTLTNLTFIVPDNKRLIVSEHGIEAIVTALTTHKGHYKLANSCLVALRNIVSARNIMELQQHLLARVMLMVMEDYNTVSEIQLNVIWILINLSSSQREFKEHIIEQSILHRVCQTMETHRLDHNIQHSGATLIGLLAKLVRCRQEFAQIGCGVITTAMDEHKDQVLVQRACLKVLFRLSFNEVIRKKYGPEFIDLIIDAMREHPSNAPLQRSAILCFLKLSKDKYCINILQRDAISHVALAMTRFQTLDHVYRVARMAVDALLTDEPNTEEDSNKKEKKSKKNRKEKATVDTPAEKVSKPKNKEPKSKSSKEHHNDKSVPTPHNWTQILATKEELIDILKQQIDKLKSDLEKEKSQHFKDEDATPKSKTKSKKKKDETGKKIEGDLLSPPTKHKKHKITLQNDVKTKDETNDVMELPKLPKIKSPSNVSSPKILTSKSNYDTPPTQHKDKSNETPTQQKDKIHDKANDTKDKTQDKIIETPPVHKEKTHDKIDTPTIQHKEKIHEKSNDTPTTNKKKRSDSESSSSSRSEGLESSDKSLKSPKGDNRLLKRQAYTLNFSSLKHNQLPRVEVLMQQISKLNHIIDQQRKQLTEEKRKRNEMQAQLYKATRNLRDSTSLMKQLQKKKLLKVERIPVNMIEKPDLLMHLRIKRRKL